MYSHFYIQNIKALNTGQEERRQEQVRAAGAAGVTEVRLGFRDPPQRHRRGREEVQVFKEGAEGQEGPRPFKHFKGSEEKSS